MMKRWNIMWGVKFLRATFYMWSHFLLPQWKAQELNTSPKVLKHQHKIFVVVQVAGNDCHRETILVLWSGFGGLKFLTVQDLYLEIKVFTSWCVQEY